MQSVKNSSKWESNVLIKISTFIQEKKTQCTGELTSNNEWRQCFLRRPSGVPCTGGMCASTSLSGCAFNSYNITQAVHNWTVSDRPRL